MKIHKTISTFGGSLTINIEDNTFAYSGRRSVPLRYSLCIIVS